MNKKASEFQCPGKGSFKSPSEYESRTQVFTLELKKRICRLISHSREPPCAFF